MSLQTSLLGKRDRDATTIASLEKAIDQNVTPSTSQVANAALSAAMEGGSKLIVGPRIKLKGVEILDCDTLVVEGVVEATMKARVMQIAEDGAFRGSAEFDLVTVRGRFDGDLTVRQTLVIHSTGKVTGTIRYGRIMVEEGGQLSGDVSSGASSVRTSASASAPA